MIRKQPALVGAMALLVVSLLIWSAYFARVEGLASKQLQSIQGRLSQLEQAERPLKEAEAQVADAKARLDRYLALAARRSEWARLIQGVQAAIPAELWISSFKPVRPPVDPTNPPQDGLPVGSVSLIELQGYGFIDPTIADPVQRVISFRDGLRQNELFNSTTTDLKSTPPPEKEDPAMVFSMTLVLKNPVTP